MGPISSTLIWPITKSSQLFINFPHILHVLFEWLLLVLVDVSVLKLTDVILVLFYVSLGFLGGLVMPEELFHVFAVALNREMLEKWNVNAHKWPKCGGVGWVDELFGP